MRVENGPTLGLMAFVFRIHLNVSDKQAARLLELQRGFAQLCNALAPLIQKTRVWNRVALHHLAYKDLRKQYPEMGAQMVCNAIYSVSRTCRMVFQNPSSPFSLDKLGDRPLPLLRFNETCPVYFDRHTLSLKAGQLSMFTLDGRMRFQLALDADVEARFHTQKLREMVLVRRGEAGYDLVFLLVDQEQAGQAASHSALPPMAEGELPEYVMVDEVP